MNNSGISGFFKSISDVLINTLAPLQCIVCLNEFDENSSESKFLCNKCLILLPSSDSPDINLVRLYDHFPKDNVYLYAIHSLFSVKEERNYLEIIHGLKYKGFTNIGIEFGSRLGLKINEQKSTNYDLIIPLPIHHARYRERGYNQAEIIANGISAILNIPVNTKTIKKTRYTDTQTNLSQQERIANVSDVFAVTSNKQMLENKIILLVDDVLTTGSTINSAAKVLIESGAKRVDGATLATA